jgi:hypothetical protein
MQMLCAGVLLAVAGLAMGEGSRVQLGAVSSASLAAFAFLIVFGSLVAFTAYAWLLKNAPTSLLSTYAYVNPAVAVFLGWALVGDAGLSQDPWTGLGMDNAGSHAVFLAEAIDDWLSERSTESHAFGAYGSRRDQHAMSGFNETAEYGRDLSVLG